MQSVALYKVRAKIAECGLVGLVLLVREGLQDSTKRSDLCHKQRVVVVTRLQPIQLWSKPPYILGHESGDDFRKRKVELGLEHGKTYEIVIFGADRHPPESNFQLTLQGFTTKKSSCQPRCGDGKVTAGEQCDCGDSDDNKPSDCEHKNDDKQYGGCSTTCKYGPFCGDGKVQTEDGGNEECDYGADKNDKKLDREGNLSDDKDAFVHCTATCGIPQGQLF